MATPIPADPLADSIRYRAELGQWAVSLCTLMPEHIHLLVHCEINATLAATVTSWKRYVARQHGVRWQSRFFDHRIRSAEQFERKAEYIRDNPVKAGLISRGEIWPFTWEW